MATSGEGAGPRGESKESLADYAYRVLRDRLVLLDISPGAPLGESVLALELGVGRTPLREALKRLESDHLVVTFSRRGTFATTVDVTELSEITEMRSVLVPLAARRAAQHHGGAMRRDLDEALRAMEKFDEEVDARALLEHDLAVHRLISAAACSRHLQETLVRLDHLVARMWCAMIDRIPPMGDHVREHVALVGAVLDGDADRAEGLAAAHVSDFDRAVRAVV
nr:GntR family transcriptional regulator [Nesterenkonia halophila]